MFNSVVGVGLMHNYTSNLPEKQKTTEIITQLEWREGTKNKMTYYGHLKENGKFHIPDKKPISIL